MSISITKHEEKSWIEINVKGELGVQTAEEIIRLAIQSLSEANYQRLLTDTREADPILSIWDYYRLAGFIAKKVKDTELKPGSIRRAHVGRQGWKELQFFETVLFNRGQVMKLFNDREKAIEWLLREE